MGPRITRSNPQDPYNVSPIQWKWSSRCSRRCFFGSGRHGLYHQDPEEDLNRQLVKSASCSVTIPQYKLTIPPSQGQLATLILDDPLANLYLQNLYAPEKVKTAEWPFTLILDDPLANSYLQNLYAPDPDPNMETIVYDRSWDQNEELGLNDIKVENYSADS